MMDNMTKYTVFLKISVFFLNLIFGLFSIFVDNFEKLKSGRPDILARVGMSRSLNTNMISVFEKNN